jgi:hypothetical protein
MPGRALADRPVLVHQRTLMLMFRRRRRALLGCRVLDAVSSTTGLLLDQSAPPFMAAELLSDCPAGWQTAVIASMSQRPLRIRSPAYRSRRSSVSGGKLTAAAPAHRIGH